MTTYQYQRWYTEWRYTTLKLFFFTLQWRHNGHDSISNHQLHHCLLNLIFRRRSKKPSKLRVTGPCAGNSPGTSEFPAQMASYAEKVSIWWHHDKIILPPHGIYWCGIHEFFILNQTLGVCRGWSYWSWIPGIKFFLFSIVHTFSTMKWHRH